MATNDLRPVWGHPGQYIVGDGMSQIPGGSGLYDASAFTETPPASGLYAFNEIPSTSASVTPHMGGNPWAEVYFPQLVPGTNTVRVYRISDGRTQLVRGGVDIAPGVPVQDFEIPYNVLSVYRAEMFDVNGLSLGFTDPVSVTITVRSDFATVHQVLDPSLWTQAIVLDKSADDIVRRTPGAAVYPEGASLPRRIGRRREAVSGLNMILLTETIAAADMMQRILGDYETEQVGVLVVRTAPPIRIPRTLFVATEALHEIELDVHMGGSLVQYSFTGDEVEPPYAGLVVPLLTYDDIDASFPTYDAADAAYATYTDRDRAYELAGAAG